MPLLLCYSQHSQKTAKQVIPDQHKITLQTCTASSFPGMGMPVEGYSFDFLNSFLNLSNLAGTQQVLSALGGFAADPQSPLILHWWSSPFGRASPGSGPAATHVGNQDLYLCWCRPEMHRLKIIHEFRIPWQKKHYQIFKKELKIWGTPTWVTCSSKMFGGEQGESVDASYKAPYCCCAYMESPSASGWRSAKNKAIYHLLII